MKKIILLLAFFLLTGIASAELTRSQRLQRLNQVLNQLRSGSSIWVARLEEGDARGNFYLQAPGKVALDYDDRQDIVSDGKTMARYQGSKAMDSWDYTESAYWLLTNGKVGTSMRVDMAVTQPINYFGEEVEALVVDLVSTVPRQDTVRSRIYFRATGAPEVLKIGNMWLRDVRKHDSGKNPFERSAL